MSDKFSRADLIEWAGERLEQAGLVYGHGTENAWDEAAWLVLHALGLSPQESLPDPGQAVSAVERNRVERLLEQRIGTRKPLAYLIRSAWFCGLEFFIDERVLVPRSPIAELVANGFFPWLQQPPSTILDLCTGSGCIAVACALAFPDAEVAATDISEAALAVARINCQRYDLEERLRLYVADVFEGLPQRRYDLIVSNPPYVDAGDMAALPPEYRQEPALGLAAGTDGLDIVRRILHRATEYLSPQGLLILNDEKAGFLINNYQERQLRCGIMVAAASYIGVDRKHNEDAVVVLPDTDHVVVIDAMGGYGNGVIARNLFIEVLLQNQSSLDQTAIRTQQYYDKTNLDQGGVCLTGFHIKPDGEHFSVYIAQAGDVHALVYDREGELKYETVDESIGHLVINAIISKKATEAQRANGWKNFGNLTKTSIRVKTGSRLVVYSDGVGNHFKAKEMSELVLNNTRKQAIAAVSKTLDEKMRKQGAYKDNSSIAIIDF